uniref:Uncharacterized protein n=1 Tax=Arundo donax TaxID=35708 RepID=A0A0A8YL26_ARUDO
MCVENLRFL